MKKPFLAAFGLMVTPDFSEVMAGRARPPHVNHDKVDFSKLQQALQELFPYGPGQIRAVNDTIDQVTLHARFGMVEPQTPEAARAIKLGSPQCEDFGKALIQVAKTQPEGVVDVRKAWQKHHCLPDRTFAPPPSLIPFLVETIDFEDAILWLNSTRPVLGLPPLQPFMGKADSVEHVGRLPKSAQQALKAVFGCPFESEVLMQQLGFSSVPDYAQQLGV